MGIVMSSEPLLKKATATDGHILRDRVLSGFGVRLNARKCPDVVATRSGFRRERGWHPGIERHGPIRRCGE